MHVCELRILSDALHLEEGPVTQAHQLKFPQNSSSGLQKEAFFQLPLRLKVPSTLKIQYSYLTMLVLTALCLSDGASADTLEDLPELSEQQSSKR